MLRTSTRSQNCRANHSPQPCPGPGGRCPANRSRNPAPVSLTSHDTVCCCAQIRSTPDPPPCTIALVATSSTACTSCSRGCPGPAGTGDIGRHEGAQVCQLAPSVERQPHTNDAFASDPYNSAWWDSDSRPRSVSTVLNALPFLDAPALTAEYASTTYRPASAADLAGPTAGQPSTPSLLGPASARRCWATPACSALSAAWRWAIARWACSASSSTPRSASSS